MKHICKASLSFLLVVCLCIIAAVPGLAANDQGVSFSAHLSKTALVSNSSAQSVIMTISASKAVDLNAFGLSIDAPDGFEITAVEGGTGINLTAADYDLQTGKVIWLSDKAQDESGIVTLLKVTVSVPANTAAGTYQLGFRDLEITGNNGRDLWETGAAATVALDITAVNDGSSGGTGGSVSPGGSGGTGGTVSPGGTNIIGGITTRPTLTPKPTVKPTVTPSATPTAKPDANIAELPATEAPTEPAQAETVLPDGSQNTGSETTTTDAPGFGGWFWLLLVILLVLAVLLILLRAKRRR